MDEKRTGLLPVLLYLGPEVMMPLMSALAAILGFLLMFWRRTISFFRVVGQRIAGIFGRR